MFLHKKIIRSVARAAAFLAASACITSAHAIQNVYEFLNTPLVHYFMTADEGEKNFVVSGGAGAGWSLTGGQFRVYSTLAEGPAGTGPICRFYARGPNSHFYTANKAECESLKAIEVRQRADAQAQGQPFLGWAFEAIAFYAMNKVNGACPSGFIPVYRLYNNRGQFNDSNHRFTADAAARDSLLGTGWAYEGIDFCALPASGSSGGTGGNPGGSAGGTEECGAFHATNRTLTWITTTTSPAFNQVTRSTDRPLGRVNFNGQSAIQVRSASENSPDYEDNFVQEDGAKWVSLGTRISSSGQTSTNVFEPALSLPLRWNPNQSERLRTTARNLETGKTEAVDQETTFAGRQMVTLPNGEQVNACIVRVTMVQAIDANQTATVISDCLVAPGFGPVRATVTTTLVDRGATTLEVKVDKVLTAIE